MRPYENKKITFESRKFAKSFLSVDQSAAVTVREMLPDSSEVQFVVRVQVHTYKILCPWLYAQSESIYMYYTDVWISNSTTCALFYTLQASA